MFRIDSFINSVGEYAYDCLNRNDMLLREEKAECIIITTDNGQIVVTPDTKLQMDYGIYMYANLLHVGDCLKHYTMNKAVITGITRGCGYDMYKVVDCDNNYLVVNNFFVASDC
nr:MAG TPA: DNA polymerase III alpha subunit, Intein, Splicing, TRANSFERASE [Caudoviricetes sp.]